MEARVAATDLADVAQLQGLCADVAAAAARAARQQRRPRALHALRGARAEQAGELVELNVLAPVLLTRSVLPGMIERGAGAVINVASLLAFSGSWEAPFLPQRAVYAASKSFLVTFTQILAAELRGSGVRAQVVCPGVVRSEFHTRQGMDMSSMSRMEPEDLARASLLDLERGIVVSIPSSADEHLLEPVSAAQRELMGVTRVVELPERYGDSDV